MTVPHLGQADFISIRSLWPKGVAILAACLYLVCTRTALSIPLSVSWRVRALSFTGLLSTTYLIYLGIWPSYFSICAVIAIPAVFAFMILVFRPLLIARWQRISTYQAVCVALSLLCALWEAM